MRIVLLGAALLLCACGDRSAPVPKIAEPQREVLEKARVVEQTLQQASEDAQKKSGEAEGNQ